MSMSRPHNNFEPDPSPQNSSFGPQRAENDSWFRSTSKVRIEGDIENIYSYAIWEDLKNVFEPTTYPYEIPFMLLIELQLKSTPT